MELTKFGMSDACNSSPVFLVKVSPFNLIGNTLTSANE
jgi:hypothetical protein